MAFTRIQGKNAQQTKVEIYFFVEFHSEYELSFYLIPKDGRLIKFEDFNPEWLYMPKHDVELKLAEGVQLDIWQRLDNQLWLTYDNARYSFARSKIRRQVNRLIRKTSEGVYQTLRDYLDGVKS